MRYVSNNGTSMTIIGILRWSFVRHLCSAIQEPSIRVIYSPCPERLCVCGPGVWVMPAALTADQSVYRSSADQLRLRVSGWSCRPLPAPRTAPPAAAALNKPEGRTSTSAGDHREAKHTENTPQKIMCSYKGSIWSFSALKVAHFASRTMMLQGCSSSQRLKGGLTEFRAASAHMTSSPI